MSSSPPRRCHVTSSVKLYFSIPLRCHLASRVELHIVPAHCVATWRTENQRDCCSPLRRCDATSKVTCFLFTAACTLGEAPKQGRLLRARRIAAAASRRRGRSLQPPPPGDPLGHREAAPLLTERHRRRTTERNMLIQRHDPSTHCNACVPSRRSAWPRECGLRTEKSTKPANHCLHW